MTPAEVIAAAKAAAGIEAFHSESFREGLALVIESYDNTPSLTARGRQLLEYRLVGLLSQRLKIDDWLQRHPAALTRPIEKPAFILGVPRTGTTLLANLLGLDPQHRMLWSWESDNAVPPVAVGHLLDDPRIATKRKQLETAVAAGFLLPHFEDAQDPAECIHLMAQDMKCLSLEHMMDYPPYRDWLYNRADMVAAYRVHQRELQLLQFNVAGRWILKLPSHALNLEALFTVYPDAKGIVLHRNPLIALASYCSLLRHGLSLFHERVDLKSIGAWIYPQVLAHAQRLMEYRDRNPRAAFLDLRYDDFKHDPVATIRHIYDYLEEDLTAPVEQVINEHLAHSPEQPFGKHDYTLEEFGLNRAQMIELFKSYGDRYELVVE